MISKTQNSPQPLPRISITNKTQNSIKSPLQPPNHTISEDIEKCIKRVEKYQKDNAIYFDPNYHQTTGIGTGLPSFNFSPRNFALSHLASNTPILNPVPEENNSQAEESEAHESLNLSDSYRIRPEEPPVLTKDKEKELQRIKELQRLEDMSSMSSASLSPFMPQGSKFKTAVNSQSQVRPEPVVEVLEEDKKSEIRPPSMPSPIPMIPKQNQQDEIAASTSSYKKPVASKPIGVVKPQSPKNLSPEFIVTSNNSHQRSGSNNSGSSPSRPNKNINPNIMLDTFPNRSSNSSNSYYSSGQPNYPTLETANVSQIQPVLLSTSIKPASVRPPEKNEIPYVVEQGQIEQLIRIAIKSFKKYKSFQALEKNKNDEFWTSFVPDTVNQAIENALNQEPGSNLTQQDLTDISNKLNSDAIFRGCLLKIIQQQYFEIVNKNFLLTLAGGQNLQNLDFSQNIINNFKNEFDFLSSGPNRQNRVVLGATHQTSNFNAGFAGNPNPNHPHPNPPPPRNLYDAQNFTSLTSLPKRDQVDNILLNELKKNENTWNNFSSATEFLKKDISECIFNMLMDDLMLDISKLDQKMSTS